MADAPNQEVRLLNKAGRVIRIELDREADIEMLRNIKGVVDVSVEGPKTYRVFSSKGDIRPDLFNFAVSNKMIILGLEQQGESLEEVFREITRQ